MDVYSGGHPATDGRMQVHHGSRRSAVAIHLQRQRGHRDIDDPVRDARVTRASTATRAGRSSAIRLTGASAWSMPRRSPPDNQRLADLVSIHFQLTHQNTCPWDKIAMAKAPRRSRVGDRLLLGAADVRGDLLGVSIGVNRSTQIRLLLDAEALRFPRCSPRSSSYLRYLRPSAAVFIGVIGGDHRCSR